MKTATILLGLLTLLPGISRADLSDSGNAYIGGQGQTVGTMTVSGNAFSVGGATFTVLGGKAGVGTSNPAYRLDVQGDVRSTGSFIGDGSQLTGVTAGCSSCVLRTGDTMTGSLVISSAALQVNGNAATPFIIGVSSLVFKNTGRLGIGTTNPASKLDVADHWALSQNGLKILTSSGTSTYLGVQAGSNSYDDGNTFLGVRAGRDNVTGDANTFVGTDAGRNTTGGRNTYVGRSAGVTSNAGVYSVALGLSACSDNEGDSNVCIGYNAGSATGFTGNSNVLVGNASGKKITSGTANTLVGDAAGQGITSQSDNTVVGGGMAVSTGARNTMIGRSAGRLNYGDNNVFLGAEVGYSGGFGSNKLLIDNTDTTTPLIYGDFSAETLSINGNFGVGTSSPTSKIHISSGSLVIDGTSAGANFGANAPVTISSAAFVGVSLSTETAGGAGSAVTALCPSGKFAMGGGCDCSGIVGATAVVQKFNCAAAGCVPTGFTCQVAGGTGGACAAQVLCSRLQ